MRKWVNLLSVVVVIALLVWAGRHISTVLAQLLNAVDKVVGVEDTRFIDVSLDDEPTLSPEVLELTDQDYDAVQAEAEAHEEVRAQATDYLTDGGEMLPVDSTSGELAEEREE